MESNWRILAKWAKYVNTYLERGRLKKFIFPMRLLYGKNDYVIRGSLDLRWALVAVDIEPSAHTLRVFDTEDAIAGYQKELQDILRQLGFGGDSVQLSPCMAGSEPRNTNTGLTTLFDALCVINGNRVLSSAAARGNLKTWLLAFSWLLYATDLGFDNLFAFPDFPGPPDFWNIDSASAKSSVLKWRNDCLLVLSELSENTEYIEFTLWALLQVILPTFRKFDTAWETNVGAEILAEHYRGIVEQVPRIDDAIEKHLQFVKDKMNSIRDEAISCLDPDKLYHICLFEPGKQIRALRQAAIRIMRAAELVAG